ncbi:hypothetical protein HD554DRAFT_2167669 [Boletus coccyginus]|nr:hypothetical protein HD554DRAFT_2167669 [Boletus coccyginus]
MFRRRGCSPAGLFALGHRFPSSLWDVWAQQPEESGAEADVDIPSEHVFEPVLQPRASAEDVNGMLAVERARAARIFPADESPPEEWKEQLSQQAQQSWTNDLEHATDSAADVLPVTGSSQNPSLVTQLIRLEEAL